VSEVRTGLLVATAGYAVTTVVPLCWHGAMGAFYGWLVLDEFGSGRVPPSTEGAMVVALMAFFGLLKLTAATLLVASGAFAGAGCLGAVRGDDGRLLRSAVGAGAVGVLVEVGAILSCDCVGAGAGLLPALLGAAAAFLASQHARGLRDAALADRA
jgi:hypothetical protein